KWKRAPLSDLRERSAAPREAPYELGQERLVAFGLQRLRALRRCGPDEAVVVAFGQERHRAVRSEALVRKPGVRRCGPDLGDDRDLAVVVTAPRDPRNGRAGPVGDRSEPREQLLG